MRNLGWLLSIVLSVLFLILLFRVSEARAAECTGCKISVSSFTGSLVCCAPVPCASYSWVVIDKLIDVTKYGAGNACSQNSDCPPNLSDDKNVNSTTSNWCYAFAEGNRCLQLRHDANSTATCNVSPPSSGGTCTITGPQSPDIGAQCASCFKSTSDGPRILTNMKSFNSGLSGCSDVQIYNDWCNNISPEATSQCNALKTGICSASCTTLSSPSPGGTSTSSNGLSCAVDGPFTVVKGTTASFDSIATGTNVKRMLPAYTLVTYPSSSDWKLFDSAKSCLPGSCLKSLNTALLPSTLGKLTVVCNAYNVDREDPYTPPGVDKTTACTGNPLAVDATFDNPYISPNGVTYTYCGAASTHVVSLVDPCRVSGDFNGDGKIDLSDFDVWKNAFINGTPIRNPIQSCEGETVNLVLFNVWRSKLAGY